MESSFDSSNTESASSVLKSVFKKPTNFNAAFEVSINESTTATQINRSDLDLDATIGANIFRPFERQKKATQAFNVSAQESVVNSESEQSGVFVKPKSVFAKKQTVDSFNVTFHESSSSPNTEATLTENSILVKKTNPFRSSHKENEISIRIEESENVDQSDHFSFVASDHENINCTTSAREPDKEATNLSISISKTHLESYINESSINDENLNNWMSDQSEDEIPPPEIPPVNKNMSLTKEKQNVSQMEQSAAQIEQSQNQRTNWEEKLNDIISKAQKKKDALISSPQKPKLKKTTPIEKQEKNYRPKKLIKPASFVTKGLYQFILKKLTLKYGIDAMLEAEDMVFCLCDTVKKVLRRKTYQKSLIRNLKEKMAKVGLIETTMDFYEFIIRYLPYDFRVKVIPCLQPVSNTVYPPKDVMNPFDKIL